MRNKKKVIAIAVLVLVAGGFVVARATTRSKPEVLESPFRLGKVQAEDLQVSVREVGIVDPEIKADVKSAVSGRVLSLRVREGDVVRTGQVLAEVEPDVNQAQSLADVKAAVSQAGIKLRDTERELAAHKALFEAGLIPSQTLQNYQTSRDLAADVLASTRSRYQIVEDHGIPISGAAHSQKARVVSPMSGVVITKGVELGETVTSGVSSFNDGTVMFTVADLKSLIIR
ncbi:MAG TPA: biotin/lipoyl-binding protein, partial [Thermoanaerobaculia bacterium]